MSTGFQSASLAVSKTVSTIFATDEDVMVRAPGDYVVLCPPSQSFASAADGVIPANAWTLTSASIPSFAALGVAPGQACALKTSGVQSKSVNQLLVIDTVSSGTITLRRPGFGSGVGMPPGGPAGLAAVTFNVLTFGPQIEDVSYDLNRRFGIDDLVAGRRSSDLYDARELKQACVLELLCRQYLAMARHGDASDELWTKFKTTAEARKELLDRVALHFKSLTGSANVAVDTVTKFSMRVQRG